VIREMGVVEGVRRRRARGLMGILGGMLRMLDMAQEITAAVDFWETYVMCGCGAIVTSAVHRKISRARSFRWHVHSLVTPAALPMLVNDIFMFAIEPVSSNQTLTLCHFVSEVFPVKLSANGAAYVEGSSSSAPAESVHLG
jgi:hypothetical protein